MNYELSSIIFCESTMAIQNKNIAEIVLPLPIHKVLDYFVPEKLRSEIEIGQRVLIPLGKRNIIGYVVNFTEKTCQKELKNILRVLDKQPLLGEELLKLTAWLADYYLCSWGEAIHTAVPFKLLGERANFKVSTVAPVESSFSSVPFIPTPEQEKGFQQIKTGLMGREGKIFLLHGVGGGGKTELYLRSIEHVLHNGRQVIFLVPEISLIEDNLRELQARFPKEEIIVFHSQMPDSRKYNSWLRINNGQANIVIGTRSAIFAPFKRLGLIIVEDEEDMSYKQEQKPMYQV
ncbi:MAG: DEAD/DEAH box helicase, partial [bacterium]